MVVEKIIENATKVAVSAAYTTLIGSLAYVIFDGEKRDRQRHKLANQREAIGLPRYETVEEKAKKDK